MFNKQQTSQELTAKKLTLDILDELGYIGCNPKKRTFLANVIGYSLSIVTILIVFLMALNLYFTKHESVGRFIEDVSMLSVWGQITGKFYYTLRETRVLSDILDIVWDEFWLTDNLDTKSKQYMQSLYSLINIGGKGFTACSILCSILFVVRSALRGNYELVGNIWIPYQEYLRMSPYFEIVFGLQSIIIVLTVKNMACTVDRLFYIFTCSVGIQFKMISMNLLRIGPHNSDEANNEIIRINVIHHDKILRFLQTLELLYSKLFLTTLATSFVVLSTAMYAFTVDEDVNKKILYVLECIAVGTQLFGYCFAGQFIQDEGLKVNNAVYDSKWYDVNNRHIQKKLINILMQTQKTLEITIAGVLGLSMFNFAGITRAAFSFMMFLINSRSVNIE